MREADNNRDRPIGSGQEYTASKEQKEERRLHYLSTFDLIHSDPIPELDRLTKLATDIFDVSFAAVGLVDDEKMRFLSIARSDESNIYGDTSGSAKIIEVPRPTSGLNLHPNIPVIRSSLLPIKPDIEFCDAAPIVAPNGLVIGLFCIADENDHEQLSSDKVQQLANLAGIAMNELELRRKILQTEIARNDTAQARLDLARALNLSNTATWKMDMSSREVEWGGAYQAVWGEDAGEVLTHGDQVLERVHPQDRQDADQAMMSAAMPGGPDYDHTFRIILPSGEVRSLAGRGNFVSSDGHEYMTGINYDVTETVRQKEEAHLLTRELHHRMRNLFATLQSIMALTRKSATSVDDYVERIEGRLRALNQAQQILLDTNFITGSFIGLVKSLCDTYSRIAWDGPDLPLAENAMVSLSLMLHELATNAAKYGALAEPNGTVTIQWSNIDDAMHLIWEEHGGQPVDAPPTERGFGSSLIDHSIRRNLRGEINREWRQDGLRCTITFPLGNGTR